MAPSVRAGDVVGPLGVFFLPACAASLVPRLGTRKNARRGEAL